MMVVDTHVILWLALEPEHLSRNATKAIEDTRSNGSPLLISSISLFEIARAAERGRVELKEPTDAFLVRIMSMFSIQQISAPVALAAAKLPDAFPGDPADRIIAATALLEDLPLITADQNIRRSHAVKTIW